MTTPPTMRVFLALLLLTFALLCAHQTPTVNAQLDALSRSLQYLRGEAAAAMHAGEPAMQYRALTSEQDVAEIVGRHHQHHAGHHGEPHHVARAHKKPPGQQKGKPNANANANADAKGGDDGGENPVHDPALDYSIIDFAFAEGLKEFKAPRKNDTKLDLTKLVDPFIGSRGNSNPGNVFPGAAQPFSPARIGIDVDDVYAPSGYVTNVTAPIRGVSLLHDTGTGSSLGSYGNFESMPVVCPGNDFARCPTRLDDRKRPRMAHKDYASPGYFTLTLNNGIKIETTATRRAGLVRYTFPKEVLEGGKLLPHIVQDWTNDSPGTFRGGEIDFDIKRGRIMMGGSWGSSFGPSIYTYKAYSCIDVLFNGKQKLAKAGLWEGDRFGQDTKLEGTTHANLTRVLIGGQPVQSGALFSFSDYPKAKDGTSAVITLRVGVSFNSAAQACTNAEQEVGGQWDFGGVVEESKDLWNDKLNRILLSPDTDDTIVRLMYTSLYYSFLSPANITGEAANIFPGGDKATSPVYDGLYCTWDTYRTFYPFLALSSPRDFADITQNYIDSWRQTGWITECRANNLPGLTQGGSHGVMVIGEFASKYAHQAFVGQLPVNLNDAYSAVMKDSYQTPPAWDDKGRQISVYAKYGYVPFAVFDTVSSGRQTREGSRTVEYSHNDFGAAVIAEITNHPKDAKALYDRSYSYRNVFDNGTTSLGFRTFIQKRYTNGTFLRQDPTQCSPISNFPACSLQQENTAGVYETSSYEYSFYAPHDVAGLIKLIADGDDQTFIRRLDTYFEKGLFYSGNEPSFNVPTLYHYANSPTRSVKATRHLIFSDFNVTTAGLPGNSDVGAMQTLLNFHLLGLYPVVATQELLIVSPCMPGYTIKNELLGNLVVEVKNFDPKSLAKEIPSGARAYVNAVYLNGVKQKSRCKILFNQLFPGMPGNTTHLMLEMTADQKAADSCGEGGKDALPSSLSTGGFPKAN